MTYENNNFELIGEAQKVLSPFRSIVDNLDFSNEGSEVDIFESMKELASKGLFYVTLTPNFIKHQSKIMLDERVRRDENGDIEKIASTLMTKKYGYHYRHHLTKLVERILFNRMRSKIGIPKIHYSIDVGFLDPGETHSSVVAGDIDYGVLILALMSKGYDPLRPFRNGELLKKYQDEMGAVIIEEANNLLNGKRQQIKRRLKEIGRRVAVEIKNYIAGGQKPALSQETIYKRTSLSKKNPGLYPHGIYEPLSETGALEEAVDCRVNADRANWENDLVEFQKKKHERNAAVHRAAKKTVEKLEKTAEKKWVEHKEQKKKTASRYSRREKKRIADNNNERKKQIVRNAQSAITQAEGEEHMLRVLEQKTRPKTFREEQYAKWRAKLAEVMPVVSALVGKFGKIETLKNQAPDLYKKHEAIFNAFYEAREMMQRFSMDGGII